jgi:hypothetical protein
MGSSRPWSGCLQNDRLQTAFSAAHIIAGSIDRQKDSKLVHWHRINSKVEEVVATRTGSRGGQETYRKPSQQLIDWQGGKL